MRLARILGPERVMGGTDCGFAQSAFVHRVHPTIQWAKLAALAEGARLASARLGAVSLRLSQTRAKIVEPRMAVVIDTAFVPARERLDFWAESSCNAYVPLQVRSAERKSFWARMWADTLGPLSVFRITTAPNTMIRTSRAVAAGDPECLDLSVILRGQLNSAQDGRNGVARSGDLISQGDLAAGRAARGGAVRVDRRARAVVAARPGCGRDRQPHRGHHLRARRACRALPASCCASSRPRSSSDAIPPDEVPAARPERRST